MLKPAGSVCSPINGITLTVVGYIDGQPHVQIYYENILKTDDHGSITLLNNETGRTITCNGLISFFDDAKGYNHEDHIFTGIAADTLGNYELYGDLVTSSGLWREIGVLLSHWKTPQRNKLKEAHQ